MAYRNCRQECWGEDSPLFEDWAIDQLESLDIDDANISTIIWSTGFDYDFSWIQFPIHDELGYPVTDRGATTVEGLYSCGLNWMTKRKSGILYGVSEDARNVSDHLINYSRTPTHEPLEAIS